MRILIRFALILCVFCIALQARAQTGTITGQVSDTSGAVIRDADVRVVSETQGTVYLARTNEVGRYTATFVQPDQYRVHVQAPGFANAVSSVLTLTVNQTLVFNVQLKIGPESQQVTVEAGSQSINTTDATVGTIIDRNLVENLPVYSRSLQSLVMLSPGVVTGDPQGSGGADGGEFSVNGQRNDANNYTVDGVSANTGINSPDGSSGTSGSLPGETVMGTTQSMIMLDALEEFQVATSTYSAEYGRQPGAQISLRSRSGTNQYHGTAFDYLRNTAFDANQWFNNYAGKPRAAEHQNNFGGVFGGPLTVPGLFSGRNRAFFFFSYEGMRIGTPSSASVTYVPSNGTYNTATYSDPRLMNLRANAPAALQPALNAFPLPNCSSSQYAQCVDHGDGLSPYLVPSLLTTQKMNAFAGRIDYQVSPQLRVFARYTNTSSSEDVPAAEWIESVAVPSRLALLGADSILSRSITNELRFAYAWTSYDLSFTQNQIGGASPVDLTGLQGLPYYARTQFLLNFPAEATYYLLQTGHYGTARYQPNGTDTVSWAFKNHLFKAGVDYRQNTGYFARAPWAASPLVEGWFESPSAVLNNVFSPVSAGLEYRQDPTFKNLGVFFQDEWKANSRLSLSMGLRWDLNPPPAISGAQPYTYTGNINDPSSLALSKAGAPLYGTTYTDFAPRFGVAVTLHNQPGHELVLRAGGGLFYDTGQESVGPAFGYGGLPGDAGFRTNGNGLPASPTWPIPVDLVNNPLPLTPPYKMEYVVDPRLVPPSTIQWSVSLEQALGTKQSFILSYVGAKGRNLLTMRQYTLTGLNPLFSTISETENGPGSDYDALQVQYKRQPIHGLQTWASYTWSHAFDSISSDFSPSLPPQRGNSAVDVRNNFTLALVYNLPVNYNERWEREILGNWNIASQFVARSAFPVQPTGPTVAGPTGISYSSELDYNGGNPYVSSSSAPGGRQFNPAVFSIPAASANGVGTAPRNFLRGFGAYFANAAVQRTFPIYEETKLLFRAEALNLTNHPNFGALNISCGTGTPGATCTNQLFGQPTGMLGTWQGGARSLQFALKLQF